MGDAPGGKQRFLAVLLRLGRPKAFIALAVALLVVSVATFATVPLLRPTPNAASGLTAPPDAVAGKIASITADGIVDSDLDGLPDAVENFVHGTDPKNWSTSRSGIPDSWLLEHGYDALDPAIASKPAAKPPADKLPTAYESTWPDEYTATLLDMYAYGRPDGYDETLQGPYRGGLDPTAYDSNNDTIPDGWLLFYGLDPMTPDVGDERLAGDAGLSVLEAFQHDTNPRETDTDHDGLADRAEIEGAPNPASSGTRFPPSDPSAYSTGGSGVCDGYLAAHGLDPNLPENGYADLVHSGATTREKFLWSLDRFDAEACEDGRGLDPTKASTLGLLIPDGWLLRYGLDPLDPAIVNRVTQTTATTNVALPIEAPDKPLLDERILTVLTEYGYGKPTGWSEALLGPWPNGTNPTNPDTDADGIDDAAEQRGYYTNWSTDVGPNPERPYSRTESDPRTHDTDGDTLADLDEVTVHHSDPSRRDTDSDGIDDQKELDSEFGLDAALADTPGDYLRDGARLEVLQTRSEQYFDDPTYEFAGEPGVVRTAATWLETMGGAQDLPRPLSREAIRDLVAPTGDADGDGINNILDPDIDDDGLLNGWELDPTLLRHSQFGEGRLPRPATDPLNPDTDGDGLKDGWETEHAQALFTLTPPGYSLDASRWDSDADDVSDGQEDPDADPATWTLFTSVGGIVQGSPQEFLYPNLLEQQFQTNPNRADSDEDLLRDGWKVYWGIQYADVPPGAPLPIVGIAQSDVSISTHSTRRFTLDPGALGLGEQLGETFPDVPVPQGGTRTIYEILQTVNWGFRQSHDVGTNPFLEDTSLDGIPDWWAFHHSTLGMSTSAAQCVTTGLSPLQHYTDQDPDGDALTNVDEFERGSHPLCADTDLDGLRDGEETNLGLDPADPLDGQRLLEGTVDTDGDGVFDFRELVGIRHNHLGTQLVRTDPENPDSDGDGLLDSNDVPAQGTLTEADALAKLLLDLGVSYTSQSQSGARAFTFLGEAGTTTHPANGDDTGTTIPAGWLAAHNLPISAPPNVLANYVFGRPAWWDEDLHGPWWGGLPPDGDPSAAASDPDLDGDGLLDADNGAGFEDPMPFSNRVNRFRTLDWQAYPASLGLVAPPATAHPTDEGLDPLVKRLLAQAYLNPRTVGPTFVHNPSTGQPAAQTQPCITVERIVDQGSNTVTSITKGRASFVLGRVHNCQGQGYHGVTVEARAGSPSQVFGATFTDASGNFRLPLNITATQSILLPTDVPVVLRGDTHGWVNWTANPSIVAPGANRFFTIRSYASPDAQPYLAARPSLASAIDSIATNVRAESILTLTAPERVTTGSPFEIEYRLTDSAGSPLRHQVRITIDATTYGPLNPDTQGEGTILATVPHTQPGPLTIRGVSIPTPAEQAFVAPAEATQGIEARRPIDILITSVPATADAGQGVVVKGRVQFQGNPLSGNPVLVNLTRGSQVIASETATTLSDGSYTVALTLPPTTAFGQHTIVATAPSTATTVQVDTAELLHVRSIPRFVGISSGSLEQGEATTIQGLLAEPDGGGIPGAPLTVTLHGHSVSLTTDAAGRFSTELQPSLPAQPVLQLVAFNGDADHAPASHRVERPVQATTTLQIQNGIIARGAPALVAVRLTDASGNPVAGAVINLTWGNEAPTIAVTSANGVSTHPRAGNASDALGPVPLRASYAGSSDGALGESIATNSWLITALAEIALPTGGFDVGTPIPHAVLRDAGTLQPIPRAPVRFTLNGAEKDVTTDDEGTFLAIDAANASDAPRTFRLSAAYAGNDVYGPVERAAVVFVRDRTRVTADAPTTVILGQPAIAHVHVTDLAGNGVQQGEVQAALDGAVLATSPLIDGTARLSIKIAETEAAGNRTITWTYLGTPEFGDSTNTSVVHAMERAILTTEADAGLPGEETILRVTATRGAQPIPGAPIYIEIDGIEGGLVATTDENGVATFTFLQTEAATIAAVRYAGGLDNTAAHALITLAPDLPPPIPPEKARTFSYVALAAALLVGALGYLATRLRRNPLEPIVRRARRILVARGPDAKQILLAYQGLQEAAIGLGFIDDVAATARTLQEALLKRLPERAHKPLERLMELFELARYSAEEIVGEHRALAIGSLDTILDALRERAAFEWTNNPAAAPEAAP